jgi:hypothetical protein
MALDESALLEVLEALKAADVDDREQVTDSGPLRPTPAGTTGIDTGERTSRLPAATPARAAQRRRGRTGG